MAKRKFKSAAKGTGFRNRGEGLRSAVTQLQTQGENEIRGLKDQRDSALKAANIQIQGLEDKARFEQNVRQEKRSLEDKVRKTQYTALSIKADRDVQRLRDEAKAYGDEAQLWKELTPKLAKNFSKLATGVYDYSQFLEFQQLDKAWEASGGKDAKIAAQEETYWKIAKDGLAETHGLENSLSKKLKDDVDANGEWNHLWQYKMINHFKENGQFFKEEVEQKLQGTAYTASETRGLYEFAGYLKLKELRLSSDSKAGKAILDKYRSWGNLRGQQKLRNNQIRESSARLDIGSDNIIALKGQGFALSPAMRENLNAQFNAEVRDTLNGWYKDGNNTYQVDNYGDGFSKVVRNFLEKHGDKFEGDPEQVREFLRGLKIPGKDGKLGNEEWSIKHKRRLDEELEHWRKTSGSLKATQLEDLRKNKGASLVVNIDTVVKEKQETGETFSDEEKWDIIERIHNTDTQDKYKTQAYSKLGFSKKGFTEMGLAISARNAYENGDTELFWDNYNDMPKAQQAKFQGEVKVLRRLDKVATNGKLKGIEAVSKNNLQLVKDVSRKGIGAGRQGLHGTGESAANYLDQIIVQEMLNNSDVSPENAYQAALAKVNDWKKNAKAVSLNKDGTINYGDADPSNPLNYITQGGGIAGLWQPETVFPFFSDMDTRLAQAANIERAKRDLVKNPEEMKEWTTDHSADTAADYIELDDDTIKYGSEKEVFNNVRLVNGLNEQIFLNKLNKDIQNPDSFDDLTEIVPKKLQLWAKQNGHSLSHAANKYLESRGIAILVSQDGSDAIALKKKAFLGNPSKRVPILPNALGEACYYACKAQDLTPMKPEVRTAFEKGVSVFEAHLESTGNSVFTNENGELEISDKEKFIRSGGPKLLTMELAKQLGLLRWNDQTGYRYTWDKPGRNKK